MVIDCLNLDSLAVTSMMELSQTEASQILCLDCPLIKLEVFGVGLKHEECFGIQNIMKHDFGADASVVHSSRVKEHQKLLWFIDEICFVVLEERHYHLSCRFSLLFKRLLFNVVLRKDIFVLLHEVKDRFEMGIVVALSEDEISEVLSI